jgi:hypothetical protein
LHVVLLAFVGGWPVIVPATTAAMPVLVVKLARDHRLQHLLVLLKPSVASLHVRSDRLRAMVFRDHDSMPGR